MYNKEYYYQKSIMTPYLYYLNYSVGHIAVYQDIRIIYKYYRFLLTWSLAHRPWFTEGSQYQHYQQYSTIKVIQQLAAIYKLALSTIDSTSNSLLQYSAKSTGEFSFHIQIQFVNSVTNISVSHLQIQNTFQFVLRFQLMQLKVNYDASSTNCHCVSGRL